MHSERGCNWLDPIVFGDGIILYVQQKGTIVRELLYSTERESAQGANLSYPAAHLFDGYSILDWSFQEDPNSIVWMVRSDGALISFTFIPDYKMYAWALHTTDGLYENVCCVPEGDEDAVYVVVNRTIDGAVKRFVERFPSRQMKTIQDAKFLDCAIVYQGAPVTIIPGLDHLIGETVNCLCDGNVVYDKVVNQWGQVDLTNEFPDGVSYAVVGLPYISELESLDVTQTLTRASHQVVKSVKEAWIRVVASRGLWVGASLDRPDKMIEWRQRSVAASYDPLALATEKIKIAFGGPWTVEGRVAVQQRDPLPLTIVSISREVEVGGS
jgi:hypothetical protein